MLKIWIRQENFNISKLVIILIIKPNWNRVGYCSLLFLGLIDPVCLIRVKILTIWLIWRFFRILKSIISWTSRIILRYGSAKTKQLNLKLCNRLKEYPKKLLLHGLNFTDKFKVLNPSDNIIQFNQNQSSKIFYQ